MLFYNDFNTTKASFKEQIFRKPAAGPDLVVAGAGSGGAHLSEGLPNILVKKENEIKKLTINIIRFPDSIVFFNRINSLNMSYL